MSIQITDNQRGLLFQNGNYKKFLPPGNHSTGFFTKNTIHILKTSLPFYVADYDLDYFLHDEELVKHLDIIDIPDQHVALHYQDGKFKQALTTGKHAFWNVLKKNTFELLDISKPEIQENLDQNFLRNSTLSTYLQIYNVAPFAKGILFFDNHFQQILKSGTYFYWKCGTQIEIIPIDMRQRELEINGQEILTEDKVPIRLNFICQYKIQDIMKVALEIKDYEKQLYTLLQLILREYVGSLKLDDILKMKQEISTYVLEAVQKKEEEYGVQFIHAGVKDIILPGEIRDILNTVLIAEKRAMANVITRREETASTRSLLNTAKLMEENQTLYRLKELEFLEKISENIGTISLSGKDNLLESLNTLLASKNSPQ